MDKLNLFVLLECLSKSITRFDINILSPSGELFCACPGAVAEWVSSTIECEPTFHDVVFHVPGAYAIQVRVGDEVVFVRALSVTTRATPRSTSRSTDGRATVDSLKTNQTVSRAGAGPVALPAPRKTLR
jgi:hypothetical protein